MTRPLLLGMNNPLSTNPAFDLYPYPPRSTGWRLWKLLPDGTSRRQYLEAFDRCNVLRSTGWDVREARAAGEALLPRLVGRFVVVLGSETRAALGFEPAEPLSINETAGVRWLAFPHPSGRNYWFNQPENRQAARDVLAQVMRGELS